jgi:proteasome accessory factor C
VAELAARFGVSEDDIIRDLTLVMCCGVPPYGAEHLITVVLDDDGSVLAWKGPFFTRPMRLTPAEGFSVLAAGRALLAVPGADDAGPLASALAKLELALGASGSVAVELEAPPLLAVVRAASEGRRRLAVEYFSAWRDEVTSRTIDPYVVFSQEGRWYVVAADSLRGDVRHFRVDRLASAVETGESFEVPAGVSLAPPERAFQGGGESVEVALVLPAAARWVAETYAPLSVEELPDGRLRVRVLASGERWLERLLLRVGPEAVVESPASMASVGAHAAARLLAKYEV